MVEIYHKNPSSNYPSDLILVTDRQMVANLIPALAEIKIVVHTAFLNRQWYRTIVVHVEPEHK